MTFGAKNQVTLVFAGDASKLDKTFKQVGAGAQDVNQKVGSSSGGFHKFGLAAAAAGVAVAGAAVAWAKSTFDSLAHVEELHAQTNAALKSMSVAWTDTASIEAYADKIEKTTGVEAELVQGAQNMLLTFGNVRNEVGKGNDIFNRATMVATDMSKALGQDMSSSAIQLGKALNDPIKGVTALQRVGVSFTEKQKETIKSLVEHGKTLDAQKLILRELDKQFGGSAKTWGDTMPGQIAKTKNAFGEVSEGLLTQLMPAMTKALEIGSAVVAWIGKNKEVMVPLIAVIGAVVVAQWAWNVAMAANPIGLIVIGIAALVAAIVWVATKTKFFQTVWRVAWGGIKSAAVNVWEWLSALPGRIGRAFASIGRVISAPFRAAFNFISDAWNNTVGALSWSVPGWVPFIGGNTISAPRLPHFHRGGVVPGAPGQEMLAVLQAGERVTPNGGSAGNQVVIQIQPGRMSGLERMFLAWLQSALDPRGGTSGLERRI